MNSFSFRSIKTQLLFWFLLVTIVPLILVLAINYFQLKNEIESSTINKLEAIRDLKVARLQDWFEERQGDLLTVSASQEFRELEYLINKTEFNKSDEEILDKSRDLLSRYLENYPAYKVLSIVHPENGNVLVSTLKYMEGTNRIKDEYNAGNLEAGKIYLKNIHYSSVLSELAMSYSMPIFCTRHNGLHPVGILVAQVNLDESLYKSLQDKVGLGKTGETLIVNKDGWALNQLRWYENAPLNLKIEAEPAIRAAQGETGIVLSNDYRKEKVLAAFTYISETGWGFVCKQDISELYQPIRDLLLKFLILFFIALLIISFISYAISNSISKPIVAIGDAAQKISSGDYQKRIVVNSEGEIRKLADDFNVMAENMESKIVVQQGLSSISGTMIEKYSINNFAESLLEILIEITAANLGAFYILDEVSSVFEPAASVGANKEFLKKFSTENPKGEFAHVLSKKEIYLVNDIPKDTGFIYNAVVGDIVPREIITIPIIADGVVIAVISIASIKKISTDSLETLNQAWSIINTSYSNLMSNERTRILAEQLYKINQQLEAQSEELQDQSEELQRNAQELQEQNIELEMQRQEVEKSNKLKTEFLSNMSHELRTPLNAILSLSGVLITQAKSKLEDDENQYLEIIERNGKQLLVLINDILDLSKIEAGKMDIIPHKVSVKNLATIIKQNLQTLADKKNLTFSLSVPENFPMVETDESRLHQIVMNIVGNAIKFTETGEVNIELKNSENDVFINIKDTGPGIPEENLPFIFDEFRQVDGTSSRKFEGTGLGLAIADKLIQVLGGSIVVSSKVGVGTLFSIQIPVRWYLGEIEKGDFSFKNIVAVKNEGAETKNKSQTRILIVEDNVNSILQIKAVLESQGYLIDFASTGKEALEYVQTTIPDGIILDLMMPNIDGFEVLEKIRSTKITKEIPVLILTAKDLTRDDLNRLSANNIQQLIQKGDVDVEEMLGKIKLMLKSASAGKQKQTDESKHNFITAISEKAKQKETQILVVEDNPDNMVTIKAILKEFTSNVIEATDGVEGLKLAQSKLPDIILLDISLPKLDGIEIIKTLKAKSATKNIGIIVVTAQAMKGAKEKFVNLGCDGYVSKPINKELLLNEILKLLNAS